MANENEQKDNASQENPVTAQRGRDAFLNMMKEGNPEYNPADDDTFLDDVYGHYSKEKGQMDKFKNANAKLSDIVANDPSLGLFFSSITDGENPMSVPHALASVYGNILDLDDEGLKEYENGYKENLAKAADSRKAMEEAQKNFAQSKQLIGQYAQDNSLNEEQQAQLEAAIYDTADNLLEGIIPDWLVDTIHKGLNYEKDMQQTADTAYVEGKNQTVKAKLKDKQKTDGMPDLASGTGAGKDREIAPAKKQKRNFFDELKDKE